MEKTKHQLLTTGSRHEVGAKCGTWPVGSGIYAIKNTITGVSYIGSAVCMKERWRVHRTQLRACRHHSAKLQNSWNKHGEAAFAFIAICEVQPEELIPTEQLWLDAASAVKIGYNIAPVAGNCLGMKASDETKAKMSVARKGKPAPWRVGNGTPHTEEAKAKISAGHMGKVASEVTRAKMSAIAKARVRSPETRAKQAASLKAAHARRIANE